MAYANRNRHGFINFAAFSAATVMVSLLACSDATVAPPKAGVASTIGPGPMAPSLGCGLNRQVVMATTDSALTGCNDSLGCMGDPDNGPSVENNTGSNFVDCSVIQNGVNYNVSALMRVGTGSDAGSITLSGSFVPLDKKKPAPQQADVPGTIRAVFVRADTGGFTSTDCTAWYTNERVSPQISTTLNGNMGVTAGRFWATIICPVAKFNDTTSTAHQVCQGVATIKLENCNQGGG